ncbi:MAG: lysophospholipid acyltransferase family protein [Verrucomicrobiae bacterium]|nr:lysophospholipid acyltransferase family protein [Verrucomicrobiae bacterium]
MRSTFRMVEWMLGYDRLDRLFTEAAVSDEPMPYLARLAKRFGFDIRVEGNEQIPESGPTVIVANHPFGGADAIAVGTFVLRQRSDTKILANQFLASVAPLSQTLIGVDVYGGPDSKGRNLDGIRKASRHLGAGGCLVVFPAGEVASWRMKSRSVEEGPWSPHVAALAIRHRATAVPIFVPGRNSVLFHLLGLIHPRLRTAWLGRELLRSRGRRITLRVDASRVSDHNDDPARLINDIRRRIAPSAIPNQKIS